MVLVIPGVFPVAAAFIRLSEFIKEDLPTFGNPTTPTVISYFAFLSSPTHTAGLFGLLRA